MPVSVLSVSSSVLVIMVNPHPVKESSMNARYHKKFNIPHSPLNPSCFWDAFFRWA